MIRAIVWKELREQGLIGLTLMFIVAFMDYSFIESFTLPFYFGTLGLLGVVLWLGHEANGSQRWINLGFFPLQPSELTKLGIIIVLAKLLSDHKTELGKVKWFGLAGIVTLVPAVLVFKQPDLGTALMLGAILLGMTLGAGVPARIFIGARGRLCQASRQLLRDLLGDIAQRQKRPRGNEPPLRLACARAIRPQPSDPGEAVPG